MESVQLKSCAECRRRKIRCNKKMPCRACDERGEASLCHRAVIQRPSKVPQPPPAHAQTESELAVLKREILSMRHRLALVEGKVGLGYDEQPQSANARQGGSDTPMAEDHGLAGVMEDTAFDVGQSLDRQVNVARYEGIWSQPTSLSACLATLPSRQQCDILLDVFVKYLNWFCGCLHGPTLKKMHQDFWTQREQNTVEDGMFIALLFAVLSNTAYLADEEQVRGTALDLSSIRPQAATWFNCSYASFFRCNGMAEPSLLGAQAMVTLNYAFHLSGNSRTHGAMFSINIGIVRAVNLHLLGSRPEATSRTVDECEMGRRVWWTLVETDWYFTAYKKYAYVAPHSFDTALPDTTDEGTSASSDPTSLNSLSYLLATCQSSRVLYDLYGTLHPHQKPSYTSTLLAAEQLDRIAASFTGPRPQAHTTASHPYIGRVIEMTLHYRSYLIHRTFFMRSLSDPNYHKTYHACTTAARSLLDLADQGLPRGFYRLWNVTIWLIAAGLVLSLDLVKASSLGQTLPDAPELRLRLTNLAQFLNAASDTTGIGSRGAKLISHLCAIENDISAGTRRSLGRMTRQDVVRVVTRNHAAPITDMNLTADTLCTGSELEDAGEFSSEGMASTARALNDFMFLQSWGVDNSAPDTAQGAFEGPISTAHDYNDFLTFFTDLGDI